MKLGSSGTLDGILSVVRSFYAGEPATLHEEKAGQWAVHSVSGRVLTNTYVFLYRGRYIFAQRPRG